MPTLTGSPVPLAPEIVAAAPEVVTSPAPSVPTAVVAPEGAVDAKGVPVPDAAPVAAEADRVQAKPQDRTADGAAETAVSARADLVQDATGLGQDEVQSLGIDLVKVDPPQTAQSDPKADASGSVQADHKGAADVVVPPSDKAPIRPTKPDGISEPAFNPQADLVQGKERGGADFSGQPSWGGDAPDLGAPDLLDKDTGAVGNPDNASEAKPEFRVAVPPGKAAEAASVARPAANDPAPIDRVSVVRQIADRLELLTAARPREGVTIRLNPIELGSITLTVRQRGGEVETNVLASHDAVRAALEQSRPQLQHALETRGLNLGSLEVGSQSAQLGSHAQHMEREANAPSASPTPQALGGSIVSSDWRESARSATGVDLWI
ncbi:MAG: flagellar hook-length control protein FliK [Fimbriimonadaceae bacterium]|nr:flagellar hook-length control protein FliK [Fimbriimonadaceae bacterium]